MSSLPILELIKWYKSNQRSLPWRQKTKNPYWIWISEVMLQQTTVSTVIPYYKNFIQKFKTLKQLTHTPLKEVLPYWSGLGYYSRIKNLYKSAQIIERKKYFPQTYKELNLLPGFGPYTARAVSALAFEERTGVLDANVIRVMSRFLGFHQTWWNKKGRDFLQKEVDKWVKIQKPSLVNQALMDLGSLVCTAQKPLCMICPIKKSCKALNTNQVLNIPLKKQLKEKQIWIWKPILFFKNKKLVLVKRHKLPVLKKYPVFPGLARELKKAPQTYDFIHSITHHQIYVCLSKSKTNIRKRKNLIWLEKKEIKKINPSSLLQKVFQINSDKQ